MFATYTGMFLGLVLGWSMQGPAGAVIGMLVGLALGTLWVGAQPAIARVPAGARLVDEQQRLLCVPKGQVADATFVRAADSGRWLDVKRCSLCSPENEIQCNKRCLVLIRDALPPHRHPVQEPVAST